MRSLIFAIAAAEGATGAAALVAPNLVTRALLGGDVTGTGEAMSRFAGIALMGLAVACWPERAPRPVSRSAVRGLLFYSSVVVIALTVGGITGVAHGPLLWPAVAIHVAMSAFLAHTFRKPSHRGE